MVGAIIGVIFFIGLIMLLIALGINVKPPKSGYGNKKFKGRN